MLHFPVAVTSQQNSQHKCHPKLKGSHTRPIHPQSPAMDSASPKKELKSEFITVTHGLKKPQKHRCFKCNVCQSVFSSQGLANRHYRDTYPPVSCPECCIVFNNPNSLCQHKYKHLPMKFPCDSCGKSFPFESDLAGNCLKHRRHPGYQCNHKANGTMCGKWYFSKSDLKKHARMHSGKIYCCYECKYTTLDIRYLCAHCYTHSDRLKYHCKNCEEMFKHHTQLKFHREKCSELS